MNTQSDIAGRMKAIRLRLDYTQVNMARAIGSKLRSWQEWETGNRMPGGRPLAGLSYLGVNVNWILTGDGPELIAEMDPPPDSTLGLDHDLLEDIFRVLHEYQDPKGIRWQPDQEAKVMAALYNYMIEPRSPYDGDRQHTLDLARTLMEERHVKP